MLCDVRRLRRCFATLFAVWSLGGAVLAQDIPLEQLIQEAQESLRAQRYGEAAEVLRQVADQAPPGAVQEAALLNLVTAYLRLPDLAQAVTTAELFLQRYAQSPQANEVRLLLGAALGEQGRYEDAIVRFREVEQVPSLRLQALTYRAEAALRANREADAIDAFEGILRAGARDPSTGDVIQRLVAAYLRANAFDRAQQAVDFLMANPAVVDNAIRLNATLLEMGDRLLAAGDPRTAVRYLRQVRTRAEVEAAQQALNAQMEQRLEQLRRSSAATAQGLQAIEQQERRLRDAQALLAEIAAAAEYDAEIAYRLGRAFQERQRPWEAALLYERVVRTWPEAKVREVAMFGWLRALYDTGRRTAARELADEFVRTFPQSEFAAQVEFIAGEIAFSQGDFAGADTIFGRGVMNFPQNPLREEMLILMANARMLSGRMAEARVDFEAYAREFPEGRFVEDAVYRVAMTSFFGGDYRNAVTGLEAYLQRFPQGRYLADARFRIAVCAFSAREYQRTIDLCETWIVNHEGQAQEGDIYSLMGDAYRALGNEERALEAWNRAIARTDSDDVIGYAMSEITKVLQGRGDYGAVARMYEEFVRGNPDSPLVPTATFWIGRARTREGRVDDARRFVADTIVRFVGDPARDGVEKLITQLAQLVILRPRAAPGAPRPPTPTMPELTRMMDALLAGAEDIDSNTAKARLLFARAELARLTRLAQEQERILDSIGEVFQADELSPGLLGVVGDRAFQLGQLERAEAAYQRLITAYPRSEFADGGFVGLGEIALRRGDPAEALRHFTNAIDVAGAVYRAREATLGRARALFALGRLDEAERLFQQVAGTREWRGEATASSVFHLGEIAAQRNRLAEAQAFYQRVYVGYQRFLPWVARAYLRSGIVLEQLGKRVDALTTYNEMLANERLAAFPEFREARERRQMLQAQVGPQS